jgi:hypothetical protein
MTIDEAKAFVNREIACIEMANRDKELRPWVREACPAASRWWGLTQQRIALSHPNPQRVAACDSLNLSVRERTAAQILAAEAAGRRLAMARAV